MNPRLVGEHFGPDGRPKRGYENHFVADAFARDYGLTAYECSICGKWHLATPRDEDPQPRRGKRR